MSLTFRMLRHLFWCQGILLWTVWMFSFCFAVVLYGFCFCLDIRSAVELDCLIAGPWIFHLSDFIIEVWSLHFENLADHTLVCIRAVIQLIKWSFSYRQVLLSYLDGSTFDIIPCCTATAAAARLYLDWQCLILNSNVLFCCLALLALRFWSPSLLLFFDFATVAYLAMALFFTCNCLTWDWRLHSSFCSADTFFLYSW